MWHGIQSSILFSECHPNTLIGCLVQTVPDHITFQWLVIRTLLLDGQPTFCLTQTMYMMGSLSYPFWKTVNFATPLLWYPIQDFKRIDLLKQLKLGLQGSLCMVSQKFGTVAQSVFVCTEAQMEKVQFPFIFLFIC